MAFDDEIPLSVLDVVNLGPKSKFQMRFRYYDDMKNLFINQKPLNLSYSHNPNV